MDRLTEQKSLTNPAIQLRSELGVLWHSKNVPSLPPSPPPPRKKEDGKGAGPTGDDVNSSYYHWIIISVEIYRSKDTRERERERERVSERYPSTVETKIRR